MATLDEIMKEYGPGEVKLTSRRLRKDEWFQPFFRTNEGIWFGKTNSFDDYMAWGNQVTDTWEIYTPPKRKLKLWACFHKDTFEIHDQMLPQEAIDSYIPQTLVKIPASEVEIEVEEEES